MPTTTIRRVTIELNADEDINPDMIMDALKRLYADAEDEDDDNPEPVHIAAEKDDLSTLWSYPTTELTKPDKNGRSALHYAVRGNAIKALTYILNQGVSVGIIDNYNATALHMAAIMGHYEIATILLSNGADIKAVDADDDTPLHDALYHKDSSPETYEYMLNYYKDNHLTCYTEQGEEECIICADENKRPNVVYIPCGHRCMCEECEDTYGQKRCHHAKCHDKPANKCPICRSRIMDTQVLTL